MTNPAYEATNSDVEKLKPGKYAILYRDNWDGEGDFYHCLADLDVDGRWLSDETGKELHEYEGDEILKAWPLVDGADVLQPAPNGMMQLSNELAEMKQKCGASNAVTDVIAERQRQISAEGWTPEHDDEHDSGEMAGAAACYASYTNARGWIFKTNPDGYRSESEPNDWPWSPDWWKPTNPRRDLVKAGALIIAEIERIDRAAGGTAEGGE